MGSTVSVGLHFVLNAFKVYLCCGLCAARDLGSPQRALTLSLPPALICAPSSLCLCSSHIHAQWHSVVAMGSGARREIGAPVKNVPLLRSPTLGLIQPMGPGAVLTAHLIATPLHTCGCTTLPINLCCRSNPCGHFQVITRQGSDLHLNQVANTLCAIFTIVSKEDIVTLLARNGTEG